MTGEIGFQKPVGRICAQEPAIIVEKLIETAASCVPGAAVKYGSTQGEVVVNDTSSNEIVGFLSWEHANPTNRPTTITTAYALNAVAPVIKIGSGTPIRAILGKSQTMTAGMAMMPGATTPDGAGSLIEGTPATDNIVAYALEDVTTTSAVSTIWVQLI